MDSASDPLSTTARALQELRSWGRPTVIEGDSAVGKMVQSGAGERLSKGGSHLVNYAAHFGIVKDGKDASEKQEFVGTT